MTRVVLADDAELFRAALAELLTSADCEIVAQVGDPDRLHAAIAATAPDLAVVDVRRPPTNRLEGLRTAVRIRREHPAVAVPLLSQHLEATHLAELTGDGTTGVGYLLKDRVSGTDFVDAVHRVAAGGCAFDPQVVEHLVVARAVRRSSGRPAQGHAGTRKAGELTPSARKHTTPGR